MKKSLIALAVLAVIALILGGLALASASHGVKTVTDAIAAIGEPAFNEETRARIDAADAAIAALDPDLHLTDRVENLAGLRQAKIAYVVDAIKQLTRAGRREAGKTVDEDEVRRLLAQAEEAFARYFTADDAADIGNYNNLVKYREEYGDAAPAAPAFQNLNPPDQAEPIDLC